jgi:hypothetical protein
LIPDPWLSTKGNKIFPCGAIILLVDYWNYCKLLVKFPDHLDHGKINILAIFFQQNSCTARG